VFPITNLQFRQDHPLEVEKCMSEHCWQYFDYFTFSKSRSYQWPYKTFCVQIFHTKSKLFTVLHPNSYFAHHPHELEPTGKEDPSLLSVGQSGHRGLLSHRHQLLTYVSLLETTKPYLVNTMRVRIALS